MYKHAQWLAKAESKAQEEKRIGKRRKRWKQCLEITMITGKHSKSWGGVPDFGNYNAVAAPLRVPN